MTKKEAPRPGATELTPREGELRDQIEKIKKGSGAKAIAVALHDAETGLELHYHADRWFHAASTIKVPILLGVFAAIDRGDLLPHSRVHVRNRFLSVIENIPFRVESGRDANSAVHNAIGKMMRVDELAYHMITTSSNLATNLLLGVIGAEAVNQTLKELDVDQGRELRRGVEDELAFDADDGVVGAVHADVGLVGGAVLEDLLVGRDDVGMGAERGRHQRDRRLCRRSVEVRDAVVRILPALVDEAAVGLALVLDEAVAVLVAVLLDPLQSRLGGGKELLAGGARELGDEKTPRHVVVHASTGAGLWELAENEKADVIVFGSDYRTAEGAVSTKQLEQHEPHRSRRQNERKRQRRLDRAAPSERPSGERPGNQHGQRKRSDRRQRRHAHAERHQLQISHRPSIRRRVSPAPYGSAAEAMVSGAGVIVRVSASVAVAADGVAESVTITVTVPLNATVGVPEI